MEGSTTQKNISRFGFIHLALDQIQFDLAGDWAKYECLVWPYAKAGNKIPVAWYKGKNLSVTKVAFERFYGQVPDGHWVEHRCRNSWCFHPLHLYAEPNRVLYLKNVLEQCVYDPSLPWTDYPCLEWPHIKNDANYGIIAINQKAFRVTRIVLELVTGKKLGRLHALHRCDNPPCFHPAHLFAGTATDNMRDRSRKGRYPRSRPRTAVDKCHPNSKLSWEQVNEIRRLREAGGTCKAIAGIFNISEGHVSGICSSRLWRDDGSARPRSLCGFSYADFLRQTQKAVDMLRALPTSLEVERIIYTLTNA